MDDTAMKLLTACEAALVCIAGNPIFCYEEKQLRDAIENASDRLAFERLDDIERIAREGVSIECPDCTVDTDDDELVRSMFAAIVNQMRNTPKDTP